MKKFAASGAALLLLLTLSFPAFGQGLFSTVGGTVTDSSGALIPGVTIRATNIKLLNGSDMSLATSTGGYIHTPDKSGSSHINWAA